MVYGWCKLTSDHPHTCYGNSNWSSSIQISPNLHFFRLSYKLTLDDLSPWFMTFDCMNIWRFHIILINQVWFKSDFNLFKWGHFHIFRLSYKLTLDDLWPWFVTINCMNIWRFHIILINQVWFKSDFNFSNEVIFTFSTYMYLTTWPQMIFDLDIWPFDLINKCSLYDRLYWTPAIAQTACKRQRGRCFWLATFF